jgi:hypothetical protein
VLGHGRGWRQQDGLRDGEKAIERGPGLAGRRRARDQETVIQSFSV